jgi:hypothetical protein
MPEYGGMFKGVGAGQEAPVCSKRSSGFARLQKQTHWVNDEYVPKSKAGSDEWRSHSQAVHDDPCVRFLRKQPPNKLASKVELSQGAYRPESHWTSEAREHFQGSYRPPPAAFPAPTSQVHLGEDKIKYETQYVNVNRDPRSRPPPYIPEAASKWPLPAKHHIIHGGPPSSTDSRAHFPRLTANYSKISDGVRDPVLGVYRQFQDPLMKSDDLIRQGNRTVPPLGTLSAVRPDVA